MEHQELYNELQEERMAEATKTTKITLKINAHDKEELPARRSRRAKTKAQANFQDDYDWELEDERKESKHYDDDMYSDNYYYERQSSINSFSEPDEPKVSMEKHFIIRVPDGIANTVKQVTQDKTSKERIDITFINNRKAAFRLDQKYYSARLIDLPTVTESYKIFDKKQLLKVADIAQMLLVEREIDSPNDLKANRFIEQKDAISVDGLAPPLKNISRRRFRPRISYAKINYIENEVLRLLEEDEKATSISFELQDAQVDNGDEQEIQAAELENDQSLQSIDTKKLSNVEEKNISSESDSEDFDADLAAELDRGLEELDTDHGRANDSISDKIEDGSKDEQFKDSLAKESDEENEDSEEDEGSEDSDDNAIVDTERNMQIQLLIEEVTNLEASIKRKRVDLDSAPNPIIRKRFEATVKKLMAELESKKQQLESINSTGITN